MTERPNEAELREFQDKLSGKEADMGAWGVAGLIAEAFAAAANSNQPKETSDVSTD